jgi:hypothetical protein
LFDAYLTKSDNDPYRSGPLFDFRKFFGPERRDIVMIWRNRPGIYFKGLDQREPKIIGGKIITKFFCQHYGKSLSEGHWEETCNYYVDNFPEPYKTKWIGRRGKAVHVLSDFDTELLRWDDVKNNSIKIN